MRGGQGLLHSLQRMDHDGKGLEFTLLITVPPMPPKIVFGPFNFEHEPIQMARCITAALLNDKYGISVKPGEAYCPTTHWCLLVTAARSSDLVVPEILRSCLENLRTIKFPYLILCFHTIDSYCGKLKFSWWIDLAIRLLSNFPRI